MDMEKVINGLQSIKTYLASNAIETTNDFAKLALYESQKDIDDALELIKAQRETIDELIPADKALKLLKEQEEQVISWTKQIAKMQQVHAPAGWQSEDQRMYNKGVWDGLQIAWNIISEGR